MRSTPACNEWNGNVSSTGKRLAFHQVRCSLDRTHDPARMGVGDDFGLGERAVLSYGTMIHCAGRVTIAPLVGVAEYVTIADSTHYLTEPDVRQFDNVRTRPVTVGRNTWLCPKVTVAAGVKIGAYCVIGSGVTVTRNVPDGYLVGQGQVSRVARRLPWEARDAETSQPVPA